jgi:hypothetical protein
MKTVFLLQHLHFLDNEREDVKMIGVYLSYEDALSAVERLKAKAGFKDNPDVFNSHGEENRYGFFIDEYHLGMDHWQEGFVTE